jgi:hypothetical protein
MLVLFRIEDRRNCIATKPAEKIAAATRLKLGGGIHLSDLVMEDCAALSAAFEQKHANFLCIFRRRLAIARHHQLL